MKKEDTRKLVNLTYFKSIVGSLHYLTSTRPYIVYEVRIISRFMEKPYQSHLQEAKRILDIGPTIFQDKSREIGDFPQIYRLVNAGQRSQTRYSVSATVHLPFCLKLLPRGFEPQTKRFGVQSTCHLG